jgi:gamma-glutamylcyclotransferase (GGCT)/AIG2-like uncharacterized protein YtfP
MSTYIFGYGSLINMKENTREISKRQIWPVMVDGLKRSFNVSSIGGKYKVLGIKEVKGKSKSNGVLIKLRTAEELAKLIDREKNYSTKWLDHKRISFPYKKQLTLNPDDQVIYFYPKAKYTLTKKAAEQLAIRPNYLTICLEGAVVLGEDFLQDFAETTEGLVFKN